MDNRAFPNRSLRRKIPKRVCEGRLCSVCNDIATGMHYGAYTCNGCTIFFRRTVHKNPQFHCSQGGVCVVNYSKRCVCRACRYEKCLMMGMDPKSVYYKKGKSAGSTSALSERGSTSKILPSPDSSNISEINKLLSLENRLRQLRQCNLPIRWSLVDLLTHFSLMNSPEIELSRCVELYNPLGLKESLGRSTIWVRKDCVLFTEYAKCFPVFSQLSLDDKVHIIQNGTLTQQTLTQAHHTRYFGSHVSFHHEDGTDKTRELDASEMTLIIAKIINLLVLPMRELRIDTTEVALLRVLLFLNPEQDYISPEAREALEEERRKYFSHLLEYVQKKHNANGPQRFGTILLLSNALQQIATDKKRALLTFDFFAKSSENNAAFPNSTMEINTVDHRTPPINTTITTTSYINHRRKQSAAYGNISEFPCDFVQKSELGDRTLLSV
uniref:Uncharacterized protein n=1 Tax=Plectus sambesii TaxID=2011161 RepID=A0A914V1U1_9BILA